MLLPRAKKSVIVQKEQADLFLVDTDGGEVFQINETAARIFSFCQGGGTLDAAVAALAEGLAASGQEEHIREDVAATVKALVEMGLCEETV